VIRSLISCGGDRQRDATEEEGSCKPNERVLVNWCKCVNGFERRVVLLSPVVALFLDADFGRGVSNFERTDILSSFKSVLKIKKGYLLFG